MDGYGRDAWETGPDDDTSPDYHDPIYGSEQKAFAAEFERLVRSDPTLTELFAL